MKDLLTKLLKEAKLLTSPVEVRIVSVALMRIILQHASMALVEWIIETRSKRSSENIYRDSLPLNELRSPSDGTLVDVLAQLLVAAENEGWTNISKPFWLSHTETRPCWRIHRFGSECNIENLLKSFVTLRNDGGEGHGLPGNYDSEAEIDTIAITIESFSKFLPVMDTSGKSFYITKLDGTPLLLRLLKPIEGDLLCYRSIKRASAGRCIVKAQRQKSLFDKEDVSFETEDILGSSLDNEFPRFQILKTFDDSWTPFVLIPDRITSNFTGREKELEELSEWANDTDSRACMLFGDGGIGKTTLTIEFLHRILEGTIDIKWRPDLITFYTAKKTRWGLQGLETIRIHDAGIADVAASIPRALESKMPDRAWFSKDSNSVIQKLSNYLNEWEIDRNSHLLILDNTETMATNEDEIRLLAKQIKELSRRVGRILLTSRRREAIEAHQIEINPLSDDESVSFLKARGRALNRHPIIDAGIATLKQYSRKLGNKPLVLEVFVQAIGEHSVGLENAFNRVLRMQSQDLGEFLYTDAWNRISEGMKHLLLLMTRVSDVHDDTLLKLCCGQIGLSVIEAEQRLEESRGIANLSKIDDHLQITFNQEFLKYCENRTIILNGNELPTQASVEKIKSRYSEFLRSRSAKISDRIERAYRHAYARSAYLAFQEGRMDDCELFYQEAINADAENGWLFDRYAFFLCSRWRFQEALDFAIKATQIIKDDPDAWFTRGTIESRLGHTKQAVASLQRSADLGKPRHLCFLQQAFAYANGMPSDRTRAYMCLTLSEQNAPQNDPLYRKYKAEANSLRRRLDEML